MNLFAVGVAGLIFTVWNEMYLYHQKQAFDRESESWFSVKAGQRGSAVSAAGCAVWTRALREPV